MPPPLPKEFIALHHKYVAAIYDLPLPPIPAAVERYFLRISEECFGVTSAGSDGAGPNSEKSIPKKMQRWRRQDGASATAQIDAMVAAKGPQTVAQICRSLRLQERTVTRYVKSAVDSGKMVPEGKKYRLVGETTVDAVPPELPARKPRAAKGTDDPKIGDRIVEYVRAHGKSTREELAAALSDVRGNHLKIAINRLWRSGTLLNAAGPYVEGGTLEGAEGPYDLMSELRKQKAA